MKTISVTMTNGATYSQIIKVTKILGRYQALDITSANTPKSEIIRFFDFSKSETIFAEKDTGEKILINSNAISTIIFRGDF